MRKNLFFLIVLVCLSISQVAYSQAPKPMPVDPAVRMGTLSNGMKYYIQKNEKPKGLADFYIVHNVGAMQEDDEQNGLAHFLEHMAFNGTENLPGKMLLNYFQANGVKFGADINAMTGQDNTQYMIKNVPMKRQGLIDTALIAMKDWSGGVSLLGEEIDNERGVILEEKRTGNTAQRRIQVGYLNYILRDTKYVTHDVIGPEEVLKNFSYQTIRDYYHKWYRPDLQCVVITGDFDVDMMESKLKEIVGSVPAHENPTPKEEIVVATFDKDFAAVVTEKENKSTSALIVSINPAMPKQIKNTDAFYVIAYARAIITSALNERLVEISKQANAPFMGASIGVQAYPANNEIIMMQVATENGKVTAGVEAMMKEINRLYKFGVTEEELERIVLNYKKGAQQSYDNRAETTNEQLGQSLIANYLSNAPIASPEVDLEVTMSVLNNINIDVVNKMMPQILHLGHQAVIAITPDQDEFIPTKESLMEAYNAGKSAAVEPPLSEKIDRPLIENEPVAVAITKESKDIFGSTVWKLKNGAKVIVKPTDFVADQILMVATGEGGTNMVADEKFFSSQLLGAMLKMSGSGSFTASELRKVLAGKRASVSKSYDNYSHNVVGSTVKNDLETMMQLLYLTYTDQPLRQEEYDLIMRNLKASLHGVESTPDYQFVGQRNDIVYATKSVRTEQLNVANLETTSLEDIKSVHDLLFDGVNGMTFTFAGTVEPETLKPLVEKYIASLPKGGKKHAKSTKIETNKGKINEYLPIKQEAPKSTYTALLYTDKVKDVSVKADLIATLLNEVLTVKYTHSIREEMGATYGVGNNVSISKTPKKRASIFIQFDTNEEKLEIAQPQVLKEIELIANGEDVSEELDIARKNLIKNYEKSIETSNQLWISIVNRYSKDKTNFPVEYPAALNEITSADLSKFAKSILNSGNVIEVTMVPGE